MMSAIQTQVTGSSNNELEFTNEWFLGNVYGCGAVADIPSIWHSLFEEFTVQRMLEIGSYEGRSVSFCADTLCGNNKPLHACCIDTWQGSFEHGHHDMAAVEQRFDANMAVLEGRYPELFSFEKCKTDSISACASRLSDATGSEFDFIFIDGSHAAPDVLSDAVFSWPLLKPGGLMIFDDYQWNYGYRKTGNPLATPRPAIDAFIACFQDKLEVITGLPLYQLYLRKL